MMVTAEKLEGRGARPRCDWMKWFKKRWPHGAKTTLKNLTEVAEDTNKLCWFANYYLDDIALSDAIALKYHELVGVWQSTRGQRIIDSARTAARRFVTIDSWTQRRTLKCLQAQRWTYRCEHAAALSVIAKELARMVYNKIKHGGAKKRRPK